MALETNVCRRGGVYYLRARVPKDLLLKVRRREIWKSLGEKNAAVARMLAAEGRLRLFELFAHLRTTPLLTDDQTQHLIRTFYTRELALDASMRRKPGLYTINDAEYQTSSLTALENELVQHLSIGEFVLVEDETQALVQEHGLKVDSNAPSYRKLLQGITRAKLEATRAELKRWRGDWSEDEPRDSLIKRLLTDRVIKMSPAASGAAISPSSVPRGAPRYARSEINMTELLELFLKERGTGRAAYAAEFKTPVESFNDYFGSSRAISTISWDDFVEYAEFLRLVPSHWKKFYPGLTIFEAIERNKIDRHPLLHVKTINNSRIGQLATLFRWARKKRYVAIDPTDGVKIDVPKKKAAVKPRSSFTIPELNSIFNAPLFRGCQSYNSWRGSGEYQVRDHRFWLPLLGLFTGARLGEMAQLLTSDFFEEDGVWFFRISDAEDDKDTSDKHVKTAESRRVVPIHPELIKIGFVDFFMDQKLRGFERLFPECFRAKNGKFDPFSKHFARFSKSVGIDDRRKVFHSFRHNMEDAMREAGLEDSLKFKLAGRTQPHSSSIYGTGDTPKIRRALHDAMCKIEYEGLDLSHLYGAYNATA